MAWLVIVKVGKDSISRCQITWFRPGCLAPGSYKGAVSSSRGLGTNYHYRSRSSTNSNMYPSRLSLSEAPLALFSYGNPSQLYIQGSKVYSQLLVYQQESQNRGDPLLKQDSYPIIQIQPEAFLQDLGLASQIQELGLEF